MSKKNFISYIMAAAVLITVAACGNDDDGITLGGNGGGGGTTGTGTAQLARRMEVPALKEGNLFVAHWSEENGKDVMTYCLEYDAAKYHSRWVAFRFDGDTRARNVSRKPYNQKPQYPIDPQLPVACALESDVSFNGYQHGHLCASADRLYSRTANDNTFYMTNLSPQTGNFNAPYWSEFEALVQRLGRDASFADTLYVVKGGTIAEGQYTQRVASGRIVVPKYYYMALLKVKNGSYSSIAFLMEHKNYGTGKPSAAEVKSRACTVNHLEAFTGIDFFHNLPDQTEEKVEDICVPSQWGM